VLRLLGNEYEEVRRRLRIERRRALRNRFVMGRRQRRRGAQLAESAIVARGIDRRVVIVIRQRGVMLDRLVSTERHRHRGIALHGQRAKQKNEGKSLEHARHAENIAENVGERLCSAFNPCCGIDRE
jgi:hypothetical protein